MSGSRKWGECVMKKFLVPSIVLSVLATGSAMAVDLPLRPAYKASPPVEAAFNWSGFYVGGHVGYGWGQTDITDHSLFGNILLIPTQRIDTNGFLGGVQGGWNHQFGHFVLGAEVDFSWSDIKGNLTSAILAGKGSATHSSNATWIGTATTRLGYTWDRFLVYGKIGAAWAHFDYDNNNTFTICRATTVYNSSASETRSGWTVGTGIEWAFSGGWSAKAEYDYIDLGRRTVDFTPVAGVGPINPDIDQRISVIKAGLNYRFGDRVVVAKY
jgi:outer membrane immunogenic protein